MSEALSFDAETTRLLQRFGFDDGTFRALQAKLREGRASPFENRITDPVSPPESGDVVSLPAPGSTAHRDFVERGRAAIREGAVGSVVLAGGMATRFGGVVKAAVEVTDGKSFLDLKVADAQHAAERAGGWVPVFLMASFATQTEVERLAAAVTTPVAPTTAFPQFVSVRLRPDGEVFENQNGAPSLYAPGHGDLPFALRRAGLLERFRADGGRLLFMSNVDNLTATLDEAVIGAHLAAEKPITVEVAAKEPGDKGGAPARVGGRTQIVESFRFPENFDQDRIDVFNTNTLVFDAAALDQDFELTWFAVKKEVEGRDAIQFERLVGELTAFLDTQFLRVDREGPNGRFHPVKDPQELDRRRDAIRSILQARGAL